MQTPMVLDRWSASAPPLSPIHSFLNDSRGQLDILPRERLVPSPTIGANRRRLSDPSVDKDKIPVSPARFYQDRRIAPGRKPSLPPKKPRGFHRGEAEKRMSFQESGANSRLFALVTDEALKDGKDSNEPSSKGEGEEEDTPRQQAPPSSKNIVRGAKYRTAVRRTDSRQSMGQLEEMEKSLDPLEDLAPSPKCPGRKIIGSFPDIERCLENRRERFLDSVPSQVLVCSLEDDEISTIPMEAEFAKQALKKTCSSSTTKLLPRPSSPPPPPTTSVARKECQAISLSSPPKEESKEQEDAALITSPLQGTSQLPSWLDKTYLKHLAASHRSHICGTLVSRGGSSSPRSGVDNRSSTGSNGTSAVRNTTTFSATIMVTPPSTTTPRCHGFSNVGSLELPRMEERRPAVRPPSPPPMHYQRKTRTAHQFHQDQLMIDVCPGLKVPLRGSQETKRAVANEFYAPLRCFGCSKDIFCIADVRFAICPHCRVISPVEDVTFDGEDISFRWGLGLGFTYDTLTEMHAARRTPVFDY